MSRAKLTGKDLGYIAHQLGTIMGTVQALRVGADQEEVIQEVHRRVNEIADYVEGLAIEHLENK